MNNNDYINPPLHVVNFVASQASQSNFACAMNFFFFFFFFFFFNFKSFLFNPHVKNRVQCTKYRNIVLSRYSMYFHIRFVIKNISYQILIFYLSYINDIFPDSKSSLSHF